MNLLVRVVKLRYSLWDAAGHIQPTGSIYEFCKYCHILMLFHQGKGKGTHTRCDRVKGAGDDPGL